MKGYEIKNSEGGEWREIPGFAGLYLASETGEIKSVRSGIILKQRKIKANRGGDTHYMRVNISIDGNHQSHMVHRLICSAFHPNPDTKPQVNHIDGDKSNNHYLNLEWSTGSENIQHAQKLGLKPLPIAPRFSKEKNPHNKAVAWLNGDSVVEFASVEIAAEKLNLRSRSIARVCRGERRHYKNHHFKYLEPCS